MGDQKIAHHVIGLHMHARTNTLNGKTKRNTCARTVTHAWHSAGSLTHEKHESFKQFATIRGCPSHACALVLTPALTLPPDSADLWPAVEGGRCLTVWAHSLCVKSFPAQVAKRGESWRMGWPPKGGKVGGLNVTLRDNKILSKKYIYVWSQGLPSWSDPPPSWQAIVSIFYLGEKPSKAKYGEDATVWVTDFSMHWITHWSYEDYIVSSVMCMRLSLNTAALRVNQGPERHFLINRASHVTEPNVLCLERMS